MFNSERRIPPIMHTSNNKRKGIIKGITFGGT
nr:MAG TPA: hypothetical protein [Caudoviricetes sp.]